MISAPPETLPSKRLPAVFVIMLLYAGQFHFNLPPGNNKSLWLGEEIAKLQCTFRQSSHSSTGKREFSVIAYKCIHNSINSNKVLTITVFGEWNFLLLLFYIHKVGHCMLCWMLWNELKEKKLLFIHLVTVDILIGVTWALLCLSFARLSNDIIMTLTLSFRCELCHVILQPCICMSGVYDWLGSEVHLHYIIIWAECFESALTLV